MRERRDEGKSVSETKNNNNGEDRSADKYSCGLCEYRSQEASRLVEELSSMAQDLVTPK